LEVVDLVSLDQEWFPHQGERAELGAVVQEDEEVLSLLLGLLDDCVVSGHGYVSDLDVAVVLSAYLDHLGVVHVDHVDYLQVLQRHALQHHVLARRDLVLHQLLEHAVPQWNQVGEPHLAQLASKSLPEVSSHALRPLELLLAVNPLLQTAGVDVLHSPRALAYRYQLHVISVLLAQAYSAQ
jgi:hypothetical protein